MTCDIYVREMLFTDIDQFQHRFTLFRERNDQNHKLNNVSKNFAFVLINIYDWAIKFIKEYGHINGFVTVLTDILMKSIPFSW